jgi:LemA protein
MVSGFLILLGLYALIGLLIVALCSAPFIVYIYNRFIKLQTRARAALGDIDVLLRKRQDLIPRLMEAVRDYAGHEDSVFTEVAGLRSRALQTTTIGERSEHDRALQELSRSLAAVAESNPALKADANFRQLMDALQQIENELEAARRYYNSQVRDHNILLKVIPSRVIGRLAGFAPQEFFELEGSGGQLQQSKSQPISSGNC